ncbi:uncharacterized protein LOC121630412 [Melanotaenia boesemani]|uniref:uncharacterized protein LOC121630412 n=1 Tax=Melanotaenia boesemani TaxID=1250792 RepID=UPI001C053617|nr:uncharacterized protein LOC121630412 [Melanotaenia boesemani]
MCESNSTPYGLRSLVECMSRATLLAHPDDIPGFLSTYTQKMLQFRDGRSNDTANVAFLYQEQWENNFFQEECKKAEVLKPSTEDFLSPTPSMSGESSHNLEKSMSSNAKEELPSSKPTQVPPELRVLSVSVPSTTEAKLSAWPLLPPAPQRAPLQKQQGKMLTKDRDSVYMCPLADCSYHNKKEDRNPVDGLGSIGISTASETENNLGLQKANIEPRSFKKHIPYRPKGGYIVDPELMPKRGRAAVSGRHASNVQTVVLENKICTNVSQMPPKTPMHAHLLMIHCACKRMHAPCSKWQLQSSGWHNITSQPNKEIQQARKGRNSSAVTPLLAPYY